MDLSGILYPVLGALSIVTVSSFGLSVYNLIKSVKLSTKVAKIRDHCEKQLNHLDIKLDKQQEAIEQIKEQVDDLIPLQNIFDGTDEEDVDGEGMDGEGMDGEGMEEGIDMEDELCDELEDQVKDFKDFECDESIFTSPTLKVIGIATDSEELTKKLILKMESEESEDTEESQKVKNENKSIKPEDTLSTLGSEDTFSQVINMLAKTTQSIQNKLLEANNDNPLRCNLIKEMFSVIESQVKNLNTSEEVFNKSQDIPSDVLSKNILSDAHSLIETKHKMI